MAISRRPCLPAVGPTGRPGRVAPPHRWKTVRRRRRAGPAQRPLQRRTTPPANQSDTGRTASP